MPAYRRVCGDQQALAAQGPWRAQSGLDFLQGGARGNPRGRQAPEGAVELNVLVVQPRDCRSGTILCMKDVFHCVSTGASGRLAPL